MGAYPASGEPQGPRGCDHGNWCLWCLGIDLLQIARARCSLLLTEGLYYTLGCKRKVKLNVEIMFCLHRSSLSLIYKWKHENFLELVSSAGNTSQDAMHDVLNVTLPQFSKGVYNTGYFIFSPFSK